MICKGTNHWFILENCFILCLFWIDSWFTLEEQLFHIKCYELCPLEKAGKWRQETSGVVAERATGVPHGTKEGR